MKLLPNIDIKDFFGILRRRLIFLLITPLLIDLFINLCAKLGFLPETDKEIINITLDTFVFIVMLFTLSKIINEREDRLRLTENELETIARFPSENPSPIMRFTMDLKLMYANNASIPILKHLFTEDSGFSISDEWASLLSERIIDSQSGSFEKVLGDNIYIVGGTHVANKNYINLYFSDITQLKKTERQLRLFSRAVEEATDAMHIVDIERNIVYANNATIRMTGYSKEELIASSVEIFSRDIDFSNNIIQPVINKTGVWSGERTYIKKDGTPYCVWLSISMIKNEKGEYLGAIGIVRDLSKAKMEEEILRASLREKDLLLREIHHRVKNNLQIISGLIGLQAKQIPEPNYQPIFRDIQVRIKSIAMVHDKLYRSKGLSRIDFGSYVKGLTDELMKTFRGNRDLIKIDLVMMDIELGIDNAIPCGLIISELLTNAIKYAFQDGRAGEIDIVAYKTSDGEVTFAISDNGVGIPEDIDIFNTDSLGMNIITTLVNQLEGTIELKRNWRTEFIIKFTEKGERDNG